MARLLPWIISFLLLLPSWQVPFFALGFAGAAFPVAAAFRAAPAENLGTFFAAILISLPV